VEFRAAGKDWRCDLESYALAELGNRERSREEPIAARAVVDGPRASTRTGPETELVFVNRTAGEVELYWLDASGRPRSYGRLAAGAERAQHTYAGHVWRAVDGDDRVLAVFEADEAPAVAEITWAAAASRGNEPGRPRRRRAPSGTSPDGGWTAFVREHNVCVRSRDGQVIPLSHDGTEEAAYGMLSWAPDSKTLAAFRIRPGEQHEVHLIESSPPGGGRARLHTRPYALPGDRFTSYELHLFHPGEPGERDGRAEPGEPAERRPLKPDVDPIDFGRPVLRWSADGRRFTYEKVDRGHQRFRLIEIDAHTGSARNLIDESSKTFLWTTHRDGQDFRTVNWLERTGEIIYVSERDGWRHLYLIDAGTGELKNQITRGEWVVRGIDRIDEERRQVWFRACGIHPGQDPYLIHSCRINFDGSGLVMLTEGHGHHTVQFSPETASGEDADHDRKYLIATYSRVDLPPVHELRRTADGSLVCELERGDSSELRVSGWDPPEVFTAKGRDGTTDIWGIICRPRDFDANRKYPVIEHIYAGPQGSFVPRTFSPARRFSSLTDLGFVVVQIDGMGTANRSKAFHDVCWQNLKDAGLPDRILWHRAVAERYPWYDTDRVGIYGTSAGGQNATAAVLFHPEFYKAAVSACGCHDNRLDKASWNEQWMGYPVGPQYASSSNIEHAHRLEGRLLLIVGEMDTNV
ncbi:MAG TPA: prolyl oligopeptidase family serine peptidase, partial [Planctomycetaceae bacterium]|nr:prolyl oligopeptidase family serine peptidase [Planctomycetaceae bacterium]